MKNKLNELLNNYNKPFAPIKKLEQIAKEERSRLARRATENSKKINTLKLAENNLKKSAKKYNVNNLKIIGITGSFGKTSVALLTHRYLQSIGKKSVLYSSAYIDSPATSFYRKASFDAIITNKDAIINIINECREYEADYLILECWEESIGLGIFDDIPFSLKVLTSFAYNFKHGIYADNDTYFKNKLRFFQDETCPVIMNMRIGREEKEDSHKRQSFIDAIKGEKIYYALVKPTSDQFKDLEISYTYTPKYKDYQKPIFFKAPNETVFVMRTAKHGDILLKTPLVGFNIDNSLAAFAIADYFNEINVEAWKEFIEDPSLYIAGRNQFVIYKGRTIVISPEALNTSEIYYDIRDNINEKYEDNIYPFKYENVEFCPNKINKIIALIGPAAPWSVGVNKYAEEWESLNISSGEQTQINRQISNSISSSEANIYNTYLDYVIINPVNLGAANYEEVVKYMKSKLTIPASAEQDRCKAILKALMISEEGDVIIISGRGNRHLNFTSYDKIEQGSDLYLIEKAVKTLESMNF